MSFLCVFEKKGVIERNEKNGECLFEYKIRFAVKKKQFL